MAATLETLHTQEVLSVAWSVDDNLLASSSNAGVLHVVDVRSGDVAFSATGLKPLSAVAFTRDGTRLSTVVG
ncbi:hypothetical protein T484DRAFT_1797981 [Baffinella frigidus]|nr:hypothetical protein T484DRAFT_1797981 [Cryptophyta sp. CCMP2293]